MNRSKTLALFARPTMLYHLLYTDRVCAPALAMCEYAYTAPCHSRPNVEHSARLAIARSTLSLLGGC